MAAMRVRFEAAGDGEAACRARAEAVDHLLRALWSAEAKAGRLGDRLCLFATGGFGRQQLFPFSDVDLLFCADKSSTTERAKDGIRSLTQALWDCGLKVAPATRTLGDLERFRASDPESSLALLDLRPLIGAEPVARAVHARLVEKRSERDSRALATAAAELTRLRHARFGNTLFHLEPNVKDAPGGLRDVHVCAWLAQLGEAQLGEAQLGKAQFSEALPAAEEDSAFGEARAFLTATRVFLHLRHGRDDNTLDWHAQHGAALQAIGLGWPPSSTRPVPDAAYWMRAYFRHARAVQRTLARSLERSGVQPKPSRALLRVKAPPRSGLFAKEGVLHLKLPSAASETGWNPDPGWNPKAAHPATFDPAHDPEIVLGAFGLMAETGIALGPASEERIAAAIPALSAGLEDGPRLWARLRAVLVAPHAADALREMHALGVLELILPEFHGIDALVIRDAYHRYTVDEHTFVLLDVLHALALEPPPGSPEWRLRFRAMLRELPFPELLYLAALLHDTGKGRTSSSHAAASAELAAKVCTRLELGPYESGLVVRLIDCHLEMSAALRRDIFDSESVRVFADKVGGQDILRMLTLFTYADISAVHPDALTPWKAENLWRLSMATANQLDRSVDEERVHAGGGRGDIAAGHAAERIMRALRDTVPDREALGQFLDGFPERYLRTRSPETVRADLAAALAGTGHRILLRAHGAMGEVTLVGPDRPQLFADLAATLSAWGLNIVTAEAFSNARGTVVDTFRFTDPYRTLELNPEERPRLVAELEAVAGAGLSAPRLRQTRRAPRAAPRRVIETRIDFDNTASSLSTLVQIVTADVPGLLRAAAAALSEFGCSVEIALIDTEGEMAIDVFYVRRAGEKLSDNDGAALREQLTLAISANAGQLS